MSRNYFLSQRRQKITERAFLHRSESGKRNKEMGQGIRAFCFPYSTFSWHFHRFAQRKLKLIRKGPFGVGRDRIGFDEALGRLCVHGKERRVRKIAKVIDDDFLL